MAEVDRRAIALLPPGNASARPSMAHNFVHAVAGDEPCDALDAPEVLAGNRWSPTSRDGGSAIRIRHPRGVVVLTADVDSAASPPRVRSVGAVRTARRLMAGTAYVRSPFSAR